MLSRYLEESGKLDVVVYAYKSTYQKDPYKFKASPVYTGECQVSKDYIVACIKKYIYIHDSHRLKREQF